MSRPNIGDNGETRIDSSPFSSVFFSQTLQPTSYRPSKGHTRTFHQE